MKDPKDFKKAVFMLQGTATVFYLLVACVIYYYGGSTVPAPALSAAPDTIRKIMYGIALPTIVVAGVVNGHVACKQVYVRFWKWCAPNDSVIHQRNFKAVGSWYIITALCWIVALLLALAIPIFHQMLSLVAALFCGWFSCESHSRPRCTAAQENSPPLQVHA